MAQVRPDKALGQHFLHERGIVERIAAAVGVAPGEKIVEIGPGTGVLTKALLEAGAEVTAIEIDARCWEGLEAMSRAYGGRLRVVKGDALFQPRWRGLARKIEGKADDNADEREGD